MKPVRRSSFTRRMAPWLIALLALLSIAAPRVAVAQPGVVDLQTTIDATEIELGDSVTYQLQATSMSNDAPSDPRLPTPQGFTIVDHGASPSQMVSIVNGRVSERRGLTATWVLRSDRLGTFTIGPGSVQVGGARKTGQAQRVTVVAPGTGRPKPRRQGPRPFDPFGGGSAFDPFKGIFPGVDDEPQDTFEGISADPKLALDAPRAPVAFLHATIDKTHAVVGEQVTLVVYLYEDLHARQGRPTDVHEATATDFVKRSLLADETRATHVGTAMVGGRPWAVKLVRKNALFPLKTGRLAISPMSLTLSQARVGLRESETLYVNVTEPTLAGRPPGYQVGDTGDFSLSATVTPREIDQHGAVGVTLEMRGTGNMPATLPTPEIAGVEWLEPQTRDSLAAMDHDRYGGTRTFTYVVRIHKEGAVDLGEVRLPYYDPMARTYNVARAAIGIIQVRHAAGRDAGVEDKEVVLAGMPTPRTALEGQRHEKFLTELPLFWGGIFGAPLACVAAIASASALKKARERRENAAPSPTKLAKDRRTEAEAALRGSDGKAAALAVLRAIETELLARTDVNPRGTARENVVRELIDAGVDEENAKSVMAILAECEDARFSPTDVPVDQAKALWKRAKDALNAIDAPAPKASGASKAARADSTEG